jgi:hypothetical protein
VLLIGAVSLSLAEWFISSGGPLLLGIGPYRVEDWAVAKMHGSLLERGANAAFGLLAFALQATYAAFGCLLVSFIWCTSRLWSKLSKPGRSHGLIPVLSAKSSSGSAAGATTACTGMMTTASTGAHATAACAGFRTIEFPRQQAASALATSARRRHRQCKVACGYVSVKRPPGPRAGVTRGRCPPRTSPRAVPQRSHIGDVKRRIPRQAERSRSSNARTCFEHGEVHR